MASAGWFAWSESVSGLGPSVVVMVRAAALFDCLLLCDFGDDETLFEVHEGFVREAEIQVKRLSAVLVHVDHEIVISGELTDCEQLVRFDPFGEDRDRPFDFFALERHVAEV